MRGKLTCRQCASANTRITPADAGKTILSCLAMLLQQDHPRGCGENKCTIKAANTGSGSPPRMRGKQLKIADAANRDRITPADAGKTYKHTLFTVKARDHPRGCGENFSVHSFYAFKYGSPPRMRGKLENGANIAGAHRITPADAGKTCWNGDRLNSGQDHPRGCGENRYRGWQFRFLVGSPPRMRGKQKSYFFSAGAKRITPADAGKTSC